jgi:hypothetical protein
MARLQSFPVDFSDWRTWAALAVGLVAATLVIILGRRRQLRRRLQAGGAWSDDPSWEDLLELVRCHKRKRAMAGHAPDEDDGRPDEVLQELMADLSPRWRGSLSTLSKQLQLVAAGIGEMPSGPVRWGNPTEVYFTFPGCPSPLHGLVVSRCDDRLAILADKEITPGIALQIRSAEAPAYVPTVDLEVDDCRKVGKNFLLGGQFCCAVPWNVRAWFG